MPATTAAAEDAAAAATLPAAAPVEAEGGATTPNRDAASVMTVAAVGADQRSTASVETSARMTKRTRKKKAEKKTADPVAKKKLQVRVGIRVVATRKHIANKVEHKDDNRELTAVGKLLDANPRDDTNFTGRVVARISNGKNWRIKFDEFPHGHEGVVLRRLAFKTLEEDEDVPKYDRMTAEDERIAEECATTRKINYKKKSTEKFVGMKKEEIMEAKYYEMQVDEKISLTWAILADDEAITQDAMKKDDIPAIKKDIPWSPDTAEVDYNDTFFKHFFPPVEGIAKRMDKFLGDIKCPMYSTKVNDNIKFHREGEDDPDVLVSYYYIAV
jgi:hypothetical protein